MILNIQCNNIMINNFLYVAKNIMNLIMIFAPIMAIISFTIGFSRLLINPDEKKGINKIFNIGKDLIIIFFIPVLVNIVMYLLGENAISTCYRSAKAPSVANKYVPVTTEEGKTIFVDPKAYEKGVPQNLDFSCSSKIIKAKFSCDTMRIVEQHYKDFNVYNFKSYIQRVGGYQNYVNSLGGIFAEYYGKNVKVTTVEEFQKIAEYVYGFLYIYGADYYNGKGSPTSHYCKWGGGCLYYSDGNSYAPASEDGFYPGSGRNDGDGLSDKDHFDKMISNVNKPNITINCNYTADMVFVKAGLLYNGVRNYGSDAYKAQAKDKRNRIVTRFSDLQVGDVIHFFKNKVDSSNPSTWENGDWRHVATVGEVYKDQNLVVMYDGGRYYTDHRNFKWTIDTSKTTSHLYNYDGWGAIHMFDLQ